MELERECDEAIRGLDGQTIQGQQLAVERAKSSGKVEISLTFSYLFLQFLFSKKIEFLESFVVIIVINLVIWQEIAKKSKTFSLLIQ